MAEYAVLVFCVLVVMFFGYLLGLAASVFVGEKAMRSIVSVAIILALLLHLSVLSFMALGYLIIDTLMRRAGCYRSA